MTKRIPKQARAIEKYHHIIRTLDRIIDEGTYLETSTHTIAKRARVGIGTLYEYFDNKEDILLALFEQKSHAVWSQVETHIPAWVKMDSIAALEQFSKLMVTLADENKGLVKLLLGQVPGLLTREPVVRMLAQGELLLNLLLSSDPVFSQHPQIKTNTFIYLNALIGVLLGIAHGRPAAVTTESISNQITKIFILIAQNQEQLL